MSLLTVEQYVAWAKAPAPSPEEEERVQLTLDAVEEHFTDADEFDAPTNWETSPRIQVALFIQVARLLKRPNSPEGVAGFGDMGVIRISSFDPDVERALTRYRKWNFA